MTETQPAGKPADGTAGGGDGAVRILRAALLPAAVALAVWVVIRSAWVCDDALITFRTLENFVAGEGLRWNVAERVQAYTHPLWLLALTPLYALTREAFYTPIALSLLATTATFCVVATRGALEPMRRAALLLALASSKAFVDYSTSGLENPVTHLLLAGVLCLGLSPQPGRDSRRLSLLTTLAGLLALTRLDAVLLALPILVREAIASRRHGGSTGASLRTLAIGALPLAAWLLFALVYYGSPLPNTAYAKLDTGIAAVDLARQGLVYVGSLAHYDPASALLIGAGFVAGALRPELRAAALGLLLYVAYTVSVGGDFMAGRFFSATVLGAVMLLGRADLSPRVFAVGTAVVVVASLASPYSSLRAGADYRRDDPATIQRWEGIADERGFYFQGRGLIAPEADHEIRPRSACTQDGPDVVIRNHCGGLGYDGFVACADTHLVDRCALTDPMLARLPVMNPTRWRVGHYFRRIPKGYPRSLEMDRNLIHDERLHALYDDIRRVTRDPLFSRERAAASLRLLRP